MDVVFYLILAVVVLWLCWWLLRVIRDEFRQIETRMRWEAWRRRNKES